MLSKPMKNSVRKRALFLWPNPGKRGGGDVPDNGNLKVPTSEEAREYGRKGGKASGEARRKKATLRKIAKGMIDGDAMTEMVSALQKAAVDPYNNHQIAAFKELLALLGEDKTTEDMREQKARIAKLRADTPKENSGAGGVTVRFVDTDGGEE